MPQADAAPDPENLARLAARLGHEFSRPDLLRRALTHASATRRRGGGGANYERLEFLGDRVLALVVADLLLARFPRESEGALARRLAVLVRKETLAEVGGEIGLGDYLIVGPGEGDGSTEKATLLADACEAVIGALYLDGGLEAARGFVVEHWTPYLEAARTPPQDPKTALQEWAQGRGLPLPRYVEVSREGPPHAPRFTVEVAVEGHGAVKGEGASKRTAERAAAEGMLTRLREWAAGGDPGA